MTARAGVARSLSGAYLSLQHYDVNCNRVELRVLGEATCATAMLCARQFRSGSRMEGRIVVFRPLTTTKPRRRGRSLRDRLSARLWPSSSRAGCNKPSLELYAYAVHARMPEA